MFICSLTNIRTYGILWLTEDIPMTFTLKVNARNDIHLTSKVLEVLNLGEDRIMKAELKDNSLVLVPVDLEPRYSKKELEAWDRLHEDEKKKGWIPLHSDKDIDHLVKSRKKS